MKKTALAIARSRNTQAGAFIVALALATAACSGGSGGGGVWTAANEHELTDQLVAEETLTEQQAQCATDQMAAIWSYGQFRALDDDDVVSGTKKLDIVVGCQKSLPRSTGEYTASGAMLVAPSTTPTTSSIQELSVYIAGQEPYINEFTPVLLPSIRVWTQRQDKVCRPAEPQQNIDGFGEGPADDDELEAEFDLHATNIDGGHLGDAPVGWYCLPNPVGSEHDSFCHAISDLNDLMSTSPWDFTGFSAVWIGVKTPSIDWILRTTMTHFDEARRNPRLAHIARRYDNMRDFYGFTTAACQLQWTRLIW